MNKFLFLICLSFVVCNLVIAQSIPELDKVKEIKLLESNRQDVRKILSSYELADTKWDYFYEDNWGYVDFFYTDNAEVKVSYADGKCEKNDFRGFNVPEWTVEYIKVSLNQPIKFSNNLIDLSKFKREQIYSNFADLNAYYNKELGIVYKVYKGQLQEINLIPSPKANLLMCHKKRAKILSSNKSIFAEPLKKRVIVAHQLLPNVGIANLNLSQNEIFLTCDKFDLTENKKCADHIKVIDVNSLIKNEFYQHYPEFTYLYTVSGGKIIGKGSKVQWDLTGVKAGSYTIMATIDDGCGFCGKSVTKTVIVKECPNCSLKK